MSPPLANRDSTLRPTRRYACGMAQQVFRHTHRVTYADCTMGHHVYYARYLDVLEAARNEFFRSLGLPFLELQNQDTLFPVIECHLHFKSPARYDDLLAVEVWPTLAQRVRLNLAYRITNPASALVLEAETHHVCTAISEKAKRLPEELLVKLLPFLRGAAD
jgi:acyl-CoA thioester hydrolase